MTELMPINQINPQLNYLGAIDTACWGKWDFIKFLNAFRYIQTMFKVLFKLIDAGISPSQSSN